MKTTLATRTEIDIKRVALDVVQTALTSHRLRSYATAHVPPVTINTNDVGGPIIYNDSAARLVSDTLLKIEIDGATLYIPCKVFIGEVPTGDPA